MDWDKPLNFRPNFQKKVKKLSAMFIYRLTVFKCYVCLELILIILLTLQIFSQLCQFILLYDLTMLFITNEEVYVFIIKILSCLRQLTMTICKISQTLRCNLVKNSLREKCPNTWFFQVCIFLYSSQIQENRIQKKCRAWNFSQSEYVMHQSSFSVRACFSGTPHGIQGYFVG